MGLKLSSAMAARLQGWARGPGQGSEPVGQTPSPVVATTESTPRSLPICRLVSTSGKEGVLLFLVFGGWGFFQEKSNFIGPAGKS